MAQNAPAGALPSSAGRPRASTETSHPPKPLGPEPSHIDYDDDALNARKVQAQNFLGRRRVSPRYESWWTGYDCTVDLARDPGDEEDQTKAKKALRALDILNETCPWVQGPFSKAEHEYQRLVLEYRTMEFYARMGDYLSEHPTNIREHVVATKLQDWELLERRHRWTKLAKDMKEEDDAQKEADKIGKDVKTPLTYVVMSACQDLALDVDYTILSIKAYAERNGMFHRSLEECLASKALTAARALCADRMDLDRLDLDRTNIPSEAMEVCRKVIDDKIRLWFDTSIDKDDPENWFPTPLAIDFIKSHHGKKPAGPSAQSTVQAQIADLSAGTKPKPTSQTASPGQNAHPAL